MYFCQNYSIQHQEHAVCKKDLSDWECDISCSQTKPARTEASLACSTPPSSVPGFQFILLFTPAQCKLLGDTFWNSKFPNSTCRSYIDFPHWLAIGLAQQVQLCVLSDILKTKYINHHTVVHFGTQSFCSSVSLCSKYGKQLKSSQVGSHQSTTAKKTHKNTK